MEQEEYDELTGKQQQRMCDLCELHILGCSHNTIHFQCEGSRCDEAYEYLLEDIQEDIQSKDNKDLFPLY